MRLLLIICLAVLAGCSPTADDPEGAAGVVLAWGSQGGTPGRFRKPRAITTDGERLYVVDMSGRIQVFDLEGQWRLTWWLPEFSKGYPAGLGTAPDGRIAVADTHNFVVRIYSTDGELLKTIGREGGGEGEFTYLTDVAFDADGNMYVAEHGRTDRIQKFDAEGRFLRQWGTTGGAPGQFQRPQGIAVDGDGFVYVADVGNHRIQKFTGDGEFVTAWGGIGTERGELRYPFDVALDGAGRILVCEYGNNRVQVFDADGRTLGILGKAGRDEGDLAGPRGVLHVAGRGIYVVDSENHRVQLFEAKYPTADLAAGGR